MTARRRVRRVRKGRFSVDLPAEERAVLRQLVAELEILLAGEQLLGDATSHPELGAADRGDHLAAAADRGVAPGGGDPLLRRLFPPAYTTEPEAEAEYRGLMHDDLLERHRAALSAMTRTLDDTDLDAEQLAGWLSAINDLRLVLGTKLDVQESDPVDIDPDDPEAGMRAVYLYLTMLEDEVVDALAKG